MITKFIFCLLAAGVFGFIAGWMLSSLIKNEKLEEKYTAIKDDFDTQRAELNQLHSDLDAKDKALRLLESNANQIEKELLMKSMDIEEYQKNGFISHNDTDLILEINSLKEEISEYKYLENENELLHNELKELGIEKEKMIQERDKHSHSKPMLKPATFKETDKIILQKKLKKAKKRLNEMQDYLEKIKAPQAPKKKKKQKKQEKHVVKNDDNLIFDFTDQPFKPSITKSPK